MNIITIPPEYVQRLARVQTELQKISGHTTSVSGLAEAIISDWLYRQEGALELTPRVLPVEEINGTRYYRDERLGEYRSVDNPHERIPLYTTQRATQERGLLRMAPQTITREEWVQISVSPTFAQHGVLMIKALQKNLPGSATERGSISSVVVLDTAAISMYSTEMR